MNEISVKYFSARMLDTVDLPQMFRTLFAEFGECHIRFIPMTPAERDMASAEVDGIEIVNERFQIFRRADGDFMRQHDLEKKVVRFGKK